MRHPATQSTIEAFAESVSFANVILVFSVVDGILFRPLPYRDPERLCQIEVSPSGSRFGVSIPEYQAWNEEAQSFDAMITSIGTDVRLIGGSTPELFFRQRISEISGV